ncbi:MAG TPA: N-acetylmuramoyl-L-alanine amidase [Burkholderiaceae bacterium]|nr:N-acetylmuramoyl-L-alanine amidase [Burkholderiaceae bacterium]
MVLAACSTTERRALPIDTSVEARSHNSRVGIVVLHYTAADNPTSLKILSEKNVSSHYLITDDSPPHLYQLVDENRRAWHAGVGEWYGRTDVNTGSIGIEIVNAGKQDEAFVPYTSEQIELVKKLVADIVERHDIKPHNIVGHSDVAPQRKLDPGPLFPWEELARAGLGRWFSKAKAREHEEDFRRNGLPEPLWIQEQLKRAGYEVPLSGELDGPTRNVIAAFQMHYRPARHDGQPDAETLGILKALF